MQEEVSIIVVRYGQKFPSLGSRFGITRQSLVMPNRDPRDGNFRPCLKTVKDTYNLTYPYPTRGIDKNRITTRVVNILFYRRSRNSVVKTLGVDIIVTSYMTSTFNMADVKV